MAASKFDHVVAIMCENRSFDNVLGYLYRPEELPSFEGIVGKTLSNPIPTDIAGMAGQVVPVHTASSMDTPDPDPGEEHPHVNTQLFGTVFPPENRFRDVADMEPPYNAPPDTSQPPPMNGFVTDYINAYRVEMESLPTHAEYSQIMACYTPEQLPVLSTLARGFVCFDHWFCEVPSQTYANRSFFHAASSSGFVNNAPHGKFSVENSAPTIFQRLESAKRTWKVYIDPRQILSATGLIHANQLAPYFADHFHTIFDFYDDARAGNLPDYSFIEPNMLHPHTDMHPPLAGRLRRDLHLPPPRSMEGGELLLARVYDAVRTAASSSGSNYANTLLLVTFDEHGGTYDHVPPPAAPPPGDSNRYEEGFRFDRSGVRIPAIAVSAYVEGRTVISAEYRSTSLIRTLRERWQLGPPLTRRDAVAPDIAPILTRESPRPPEEWPKVSTRPLGLIAEVEAALDRSLSHLERDLAGEALAYEAHIDGGTPVADARTLSLGEARTHFTRIQRNHFPGVARGRQE